MSKNKSGLIKKIGKAIAKTVVGAGLCLLPVLSNAQDYSSIQRGVNAGILKKKEETPTHRVYEFKFNKDLERAIKNSKDPQLYTTDKKSYIKFNNDTSAFDLYYSKENFNEFEEGEVIGLTVREKGKVGVCDPKGLGRKGSYLPSFYWSPTHTYFEQPIDTVYTVIKETKETEKQPVNNNYNFDIDINNNTYFLGDTAKAEEPKESNLEFRVLVEGTKTFNNDFYGASVNSQFGKFGKIISLGPYAELGFGKDVNHTSTPVDVTTLLNQTLDLYARTQGLRTESSEYTRPVEFGGKLSLDTKEDRFRVNFGYGFAQEKFSTSGIYESGYDWISENGEVVGEKKPYDFQLEKGKTEKNWVPTQEIGIDVQPSKKAGFYFGAEVKHIGEIGKINSNMKDMNYNVKAGWNFGRKK